MEINMENVNIEELSFEEAMKQLQSLVSDLESGNITPQKQDGEKASYAPIIKKEMAFLDFKKMTAEEIHNAVRGYYSWPCAFFFLDGKRIKVIKCLVGNPTDKEPGTVTENTNELVIACKDGKTVRLVTVQPEGSKSMTAKQMLCGHSIPVGTAVGK